MIEVGLAEILTVTGAILTPLLIVIRVLWNDRVKRETSEETRQTADRQAYDSMRDRMQEKIDSANTNAINAVSTATTALNSMKDALNSVQQTQSEQAAQWPIFKQEVLQGIQQALKARVD